MAQPTLPSDREVQQTVQAVARALLEKQYRLAAAESCTGGWIAKCCTDLAGSSAWFECGFVTYSNEAKQQMLGVSAALLEAEGAVSEAVADGMARGALANSSAEVALAVTGIAGPDGGTEQKPVGTVWFGWAVANGAVWTERAQFPGGRDAVRRYSVIHALQGLLGRL